MSTPSLPIAADGAFGASPSAAADAVATPPLPGAAAATTDATPDVPPPAPAAASGVAGSTASLGEGAGNADAQPSASKTRFYQLLSEREEKSEGPTGAKYLTREEYDYATSVVDQSPSDSQASSAPNEAPVLCQPISAANEDAARKRGASEAGLETHPSDSPGRALLRAGAVAAVTRQAKQVNARRAAHSKAVLEVGDVCNLKIEGNVLGATDMPNVPVAVSLVRSSGAEGGPPTHTYKVASRDGFIKGYFQRDRLDYVSSVTMEIMDINFNKPGMKHDLTDAQASALYNVSGGGSMCGCKKADCASSNLCGCRRKNKFCTTKCHGGRGKNPNCTDCPPAHP